VLQAGGGASVGSQASYTGGPGGGGGRAPGSSGREPTIIWTQYGPLGGNLQDFARTLVGVQNQLAQSGRLKVVATTALTNGPKLT
jgi:hypothetical protein